MFSTNSDSKVKFEMHRTVNLVYYKNKRFTEIQIYKFTK